MVSLRRKVFECRRLFRHKTIIGILLFLGFITFVFYFKSTSANSTGQLVRSPNNRANLGNDKSDGFLDDSDPDIFFMDGVLGDFEQEMPPKRNEPGDYGKAITVDGNKPEVQSALAEFGFNTFVSDMISMNRTVPDVRMNECKFWHYPTDLPTASVIIPFHNEGWSPLLRTVHSVLLRSPPHLLKEIIIVDDYSSKEHLKDKLDDYLKENFDGKVKLIRNAEREGLIRTRIIGAKAAEGEVVVFLDAHCEVNYNWLPPLLAPIRYNRKLMTVPVIDVIDMNTWEYRLGYGDAARHFRGIFEWGMIYKEAEIPAEERARRPRNSEPFRSPTHAGGLFAIDKKWFEALGYYDPGLQIWGGEQYELSFKIWQCGGGIIFVPCSHAGHVYRKRMPYGLGKFGGKPIISTNMLRVIKTWMDEYDKYYFIREPAATKREFGDISGQLELRKRLNCKSFDWYVKNVAYDVTKDFPLLPENDVWGEAKNAATGKCIDTLGNPAPGIVGTTSCHGFGGNQLFRLNKAGQLAHGELCIQNYSNQLKINHCKKGTVDGPYQYDKNTQQIRDTQRSLCLTVSSDSSSKDLLQTTCDDSNVYQKFVWTEEY